MGQLLEIDSGKMAGADTGLRHITHQVKDTWYSIYVGLEHAPYIVREQKIKRTGKEEGKHPVKWSRDQIKPWEERAKQTTNKKQCSIQNGSWMQLIVEAFPRGLCHYLLLWTSTLFVSSHVGYRFTYRMCLYRTYDKGYEYFEVCAFICFCVV